MHMPLAFGIQYNTIDIYCALHRLKTGFTGYIGILVRFHESVEKY